MFNKKLINQISILLKYSELKKSTFKSNAYSNMIKFLSTIPYDITQSTHKKFIAEHGKQATNGLKTRIEEFVNTGSLTGLAEAEKYILDSEFVSKIAGIGPVLTQKFVELGYTNKRTIHLAIESDKLKLTKMQELGLRYYDDLNSRIPRGEISSIFANLRTYIPKVSIVTGSYRRGALDSGDIDILCRCEKGDTMESVYKSISEIKEYIDTFTKGDERFTFLYREYAGKVRQVDILLLQPSEYWTGILYFTGSADFNVAMRSYAKSIGYKLNQRTICKLSDMIPIIVNSEKEIFDILGLEYVDPEYRINGDNLISV